MVREYISYDAATGKLYWIKKPCRKIRVGQLSGSKCAGEYLAFRLFGVRYLNHQYIWEMHNGAIPEGMLVDHINRDKHDNRIENLRLATPSQNSANSNRFGNRNCYWNPRVNKWQVRVQYKGKHYHAGRYFSDIVEAREYAQQLRNKVHAEFSTVF